jgi:hypothetical protein
MLHTTPLPEGIGYAVWANDDAIRKRMRSRNFFELNLATFWIGTADKVAILSLSKGGVEV